MVLLPLLEELSALKAQTASPRGIALARQQWLQTDDGLPVYMHALLTTCLDAFFQLCRAPTSVAPLWATHPATVALQTCLAIHLQCAQADATLATELGAQGTHAPLVRLLQWQPDFCQWTEDDADCLVGLQDLAGAIALASSSSSGSSHAAGRQFPMKRSPYPRDLLAERLPLAFTIRPAVDPRAASVKEEELVLIHQVTHRQSAQEDVGFVMWPSAVVLARWLLSHPSLVEQAPRLLEIGAGCGLVGLLAARLRQTSTMTTVASPVLLTDFNRTVLDNLEANILLNGVEAACATIGLDFYQQTGRKSVGWKDMDGNLQEPVDVVLAADMICQPSDAVAAANTLHDCLREGGCAYVVCADAAHRFGVDHFAGECHRVGLSVTATSVADLCEGALLRGPEMELTAGYVEGMNLTMFVIDKPMQ